MTTCVPCATATRTPSCSASTSAAPRPSTVQPRRWGGGSGPRTSVPVGFGGLKDAGESLRDLGDTGSLTLRGLGGQRCGDASPGDPCEVWRIQGHKETDPGKSLWGLRGSEMWGHHPMGVHVRFGGLTDTGTLTLQGLGDVGTSPPWSLWGQGVQGQGNSDVGDPCRVWSAQRLYLRRSLWGLGGSGMQGHCPGGVPVKLGNHRDIDLGSPIRVLWVQGCQDTVLGSPCGVCGAQGDGARVSLWDVGMQG